MMTGMVGAALATFSERAASAMVIEISNGDIGMFRFGTPHTD